MEAESKAGTGTAGQDMGPGWCDCCNNEPAIGVAASGIGPFSIAWGQKCLNAGAEPRWAVEAILDMNDGIENCAEWFKEVKVWVNCGYIRAEDFANTYKHKDPMEDPTEYVPDVIL